MRLPPDRVAFFLLAQERGGIVKEVRRTKPGGFDVAQGLCTDVCAQMSRDRHSPGWVLGVYPSEEDDNIGMLEFEL